MRRATDPELAQQRRYQEAFYGRNPEMRGVYQAEYERRNPEKRSAYRKVQWAVKTGRLTKEPCLFCGAAKVEAHHHDYTLPLMVTWLCRRHHKLAHREVLV